MSTQTKKWVRVSFCLKPEEYRLLRRQAGEGACSISALIRDCLSYHFGLKPEKSQDKLTGNGNS